MRIAIYFLCFLNLALWSCESKTEGSTDNAEIKAATLLAGNWRATIAGGGGEVPFNMELRTDGEKWRIDLVNGVEHIPIDSMHIVGDSIYIPMHIFDAQIVARISETEMKGYYQKLDTDKNYQLPFYAQHNINYRFAFPEGFSQHTNKQRLAPKWEVTFIDKNQQKTPAVGVFEQINGKVLGTFLTQTGDYRFLEGIMIEDSLFLSTFDGSHIYLFKAKVSNDSISGAFWAGKSGYSTWTGSPNPKASLANPNSLSNLKKGEKSIMFTFPDVMGKKISPTDEKYQDKVLILQIFGTWCPNCMDETQFLADWYAKNKERGVEIIGLSFEYKNDYEYAKKRIKKVIDRFQVGYDFVFAGSNSPEDRAKALPMIEKISAFPTTIFIDKQGIVRKIHTGFSGPGTGEYYEEFKREFDKTVDELLKEK